MLEFLNVSAKELTFLLTVDNREGNAVMADLECLMKLMVDSGGQVVFILKDFPLEFLGGPHHGQ